MGISLTEEIANRTLSLMINAKDMRRILHASIKGGITAVHKTIKLVQGLGKEFRVLFTGGTMMNPEFRRIITYVRKR